MGNPQSKKDIPECAIYHDGYTKEMIDLVRSLSVILTLMLVPYQFAFKESPSYQNSGITIVLIIVDGLYLVRCVLDAFFITYLDINGFRITDDKLIFKKFVKSKLKILYRILSLIPFYLINVDWTIIKSISILEMDSVHFLPRFLLKYVSPFLTLYRSLRLYRSVLQLKNIRDFCKQ